MPVFPHPDLISPTSQHTHTIILLHGRGSNGPEFAQELFESRTSKDLTLPAHLPSWKWVFPSSQTRYSTLFQEDLDEWFDIYSLTDPTLRAELQAEGLRQSIAFIQKLIQDEAKHVPRANIVLGGISQGCATAIRAMLNLNLSGRDLGAFVGFCGWMPFPGNVQASHSTSSIGMEKAADIANDSQGLLTHNTTPATPEPSTEPKPTQLHPDSLLVAHSAPHPCPPRALQHPHEFPVPVFVSHCKDDEMVDFALGVQLRDILRKVGVTVTWKEYDDGGHWIKEPKGFDDLVEFLGATFGSVCFG